MIDVFVKRDVSTFLRLWDDQYVQHNPLYRNGTADLAALIPQLPATFAYEPGFVIEQGDLVMMRGRYTGAFPKPMAAVDIFRMQAGKVVEHWDLFQEDVPADRTASGNPMFAPDEAGALAPAIAARPDERRNAEIVRIAMHDVFARRELDKVALYWDEHYVQHNPLLPNGTAPLLSLLQQFPANFSYEAGFSIAQGDLVMLRGRYTGIAPTPMIIADIFRLTDGKIAEHWDIMQPETPASETKSGNPMYSPDEATSALA